MYDEEFSDSRVPAAYLITFRCYGTWLHGDARGSVDCDHNIYRTSFLPPDDSRQEAERRRLKQPPVKLDEASRIAVDRAIRNVCAHRGWLLHATNVRTNHVHVVVAAPVKPDKVLSDFKAYATREMRNTGAWGSDFSPWSAGGSTKYLWRSRSVDRAIDYVLNNQGDNLIPDFTDKNDAPGTASDGREEPVADAPGTASDGREEPVADAPGTASDGREAGR
ncbi:MAG: transposase [Blastocatellia bacterium]|nr:transposase [Blastocatellia bacterium]